MRVKFPSLRGRGKKGGRQFSDFSKKDDSSSTHLFTFNRAESRLVIFAPEGSFVQGKEVKRQKVLRANPIDVCATHRSQRFFVWETATSPAEGRLYILLLLVIVIVNVFG